MPDRFDTIVDAPLDWIFDGGQPCTMDVMAQANKLLAAGREREAVALVERAAVAGDMGATLHLANWRFYGLHGPRNLALAHQLLGQAAAAGNERATLLLATLLANGTGAAEDPVAARALLARIAGTNKQAAAQIAIADRPEPPAAAREPLSADPEVTLLRGFLTADECAYLIASATPWMRPSSIIDPATKRPRPHPHRDSSDSNYGPAEEDLVIRRVNRRIARLTGSDIEAGEPLQILAYAPGQQYRLHHDAIPGGDNQRVSTVLLWLNDDYQGGETAFPDLQLTTRGRRGDALFFSNVTAEGTPNVRMRHAGLPVQSGRKWLATRWIRQRSFVKFDELLA